MNRVVLTFGIEETVVPAPGLVGVLGDLPELVVAVEKLAEEGQARRKDLDRLVEALAAIEPGELGRRFASADRYLRDNYGFEQRRAEASHSGRQHADDP